VPSVWRLPKSHGLRLDRGDAVGEQHGLRGDPGGRSDEQKMNYIPKICSGEYSAGGFGLTETGQAQILPPCPPKRSRMAVITF